jgi:site-specific recombinase XerD
LNERKSNYYGESPQILRDFLSYHETIQAHSPKTVDEYFLDLRTFFRFLKLEKGLVPRTAEFSEISILDVDIALVGSVTLTDVYSFMNYLSRDRGLGPAARARKIAAIRSFYKYLTHKAKLLAENPMQDLDAPHLKKTLPRYLDLDQSIHLLESIDGRNRERDYCILTLFLNCGVRISELVGLNLTDVRGDQLRVLGKGNKERILFLNDACRQALDDWLAVRPSTAAADKNALFLTRRHTRMTTDAVHYMVKQRLKRAGLDASQYSSHKLRHTAATLMLQNGVDVRTLQEVLGHEHLNTTQIYTHVDNENLRSAAKANPLSKMKAPKK